MILVRLARIPDGADHQWTIIEANGTATGAAMRDGKPLLGLSELTALVPADAVTGTVLFKVAAGPWETIQTCGKDAGAVGTNLGLSYMWGNAIATKKGTAFSVTHNIDDKPVRLVAVSADGEELPGEIGSATGVKDFRLITVEFDLPPERIKEFRLQTRPFEKVEIPRIALKRK